MDSFIATLASEPPTVSLGGEFLEWNVLHAPVLSAAEDHSLVAMSRFTKRVHCSLSVAAESMNKEERYSWPVIVTPISWGGVTSGRASTQVLQEFDDNSCVLVHNVQGCTNLRYICLVRRHQWTEREGKRAITYTMLIADSEANKHSRFAEANEDEVQWVTEGGAHQTMIEVDAGTIDVVYDH